MTLRRQLGYWRLNWGTPADGALATEPSSRSTMAFMAKRCLPLDGDDDELALQAAGFAAIRKTEILTPTELGFRAHMEAGRAEAASERLLSRGSLLVTDDGRIDGIAGLTLRPTRHEMIIDGHSTNTWCAFDSVGIPAALGVDATARTACGHCGSPIEVSFTAGATRPSELWGWIPALDPNERALIANFCSKADLFCSRDHLEAWWNDQGRPAGDPCPMEELLEMGRATWEHCVA